MAPDVRDIVPTDPGSAQALSKDFPAGTHWVIQGGISPVRRPQEYECKVSNLARPIYTAHPMTTTQPLGVKYISYSTKRATKFISQCYVEGLKKWQSSDDHTILDL